jgi:hypothetical protein
MRIKAAPSAAAHCTEKVEFLVMTISRFFRSPDGSAMIGDYRAATDSDVMAITGMPIVPAGGPDAVFVREPERPGGALKCPRLRAFRSRLVFSLAC